MKFIDLHCDTLMLAYAERQKDMYQMSGMFDIKRMKESGAMAQFFAIFMPPPGIEQWLKREQPIDDQEYMDYCFAAYEETLSKNADLIAPAGNVKELLENEKNGKMSGLLTFEDGRMIQGDLANLKRYYDKGIRLISLTWNAENCFGFPNSTDTSVMEKGLKSFGKEAIEEMNALGIIIDVSHLSDGGFWDVAEVSRKPFVASHSNSRVLSPHQRNLTDDMLKKLADLGGVAGINFGPEFLNEDLTCKDSTLELISKHIRHMIAVGGVECVALGSDFDGIMGNLEVGNIDEVALIFDRLKKDGLSETMIEKIAWKNALRVMKDVL